MKKYVNVSASNNVLGTMLVLHNGMDVGVFSLGYFGVTKVYSPTLLTLQGV